ncbi:MOSC domain-containing protein [Paenibacillus aceti]|uniref:MOSC domain-containing protein n=1 Tax=Paenibacillus aceti TaxID=1820010 RepID=A0ABQ1W9E4_9BACL|nr:MOSC domain-containing protein [Paenibacillus aceti]GGG20048.1 MOSC domain-containing protein [Paenibacillus aceti]
MENAKIISINIGKPIQVQYNNREVSTGIFKKSIDEPVFLTSLNFEGDGQADLVHHGGRDKAVCVYPYEHYPYWEQELGRALKYSAFGENLTTQGLLETEVCIGDIFQLGEAVVQVSQPRQPCFKLSVRYGAPDMPMKVQETGYTGFYFRVLQEGLVSKSDNLIRTSRHPKGISVSYANQIMHRDKNDREGIKKILEVEELSASWRKTFVKRLEGNVTDTKERLTGDKRE